MRIWNLPAFVTYFTPLKGLYFSPYMSSRFTFSPETAICEMVKCTLEGEKRERERERERRLVYCNGRKAYVS